MVKHIVLWTLKDEEKKDEDRIIAGFQKRFKALLGVVDGLTAIEVGKNYNGGDFDMVLNCEFTTKEAQDSYQTNPAHLAIATDVRKMVCNRVCVDYETE